MSRVDEVFEKIKSLTVMEAVELVKLMEKTFGVSAKPAVIQQVTDTVKVIAEEKTEFDVVLTGVGANKINVIKIVREVTSLGLKEAKDLVDAAPKTIKGGVGKDEAAAIRAKLEAAGATVEVQ